MKVPLICKASLKGIYTMSLEPKLVAKFPEYFGKFFLNKATLPSAALSSTSESELGNMLESTTANDTKLSAAGTKGHSADFTTRAIDGLVNTAIREAQKQSASVSQPRFARLACNISNLFYRLGFFLLDRGFFFARLFRISAYIAQRYGLVPREIEGLFDGRDVYVALDKPYKALEKLPNLYTKWQESHREVNGLTG